MKGPELRVGSGAAEQRGERSGKKGGGSFLKTAVRKKSTRNVGKKAASSREIENTKKKKKTQSHAAKGRNKSGFRGFP